MPEHAAEVQGSECGREAEREVGGADSPRVPGQKEELHGVSFLGAWGLREHSGFGGVGAQKLHPHPGGKRKEGRAVKPWDYGEVNIEAIEGRFAGMAPREPSRVSAPL